MTQQMTSTTATPIRIDAEHYQIESTSKERLGRAYDLVFNHEQKRWACNCPDSRHNNNPRCKHVRRLAEWIREQEANEQRIQAQAAAVVEQAFAQAVEPEQEYREYGPALPAPAYFTELDDRLARLEGRMQATECETALVDDQLRELRKALAEECEARQQLQAELEVLRAEIQSLRQEATNKIDAAFHVLWDYANGVRKHSSERHHRQREEIETLQAQVTELAKREPVRIEAQVVAVASKHGTKRVASTQDAKPEAVPQIKELERDGKLIGLEIDGYQVKVAHGMVMACPCPDGQMTYCKHCKAGEAHLEARKRGNAPLGSNKPFSLVR